VAALLGILLDFGGKAPRWEVTEEQARIAFEGVQEMLREPEVLRDWIHGLPTHLQFDFSALAISARIEQLFEDGWRACIYLSRRLTVAEEKAVGKDSAKGEGFALLWPLAVCKTHLKPLKFFFVTSDSGNLAWLKACTTEQALRVRAKIERNYSLSQLRFSHVPGVLNRADAASRDPDAPEAVYGDEVSYALVHPVEEGLDLEKESRPYALVVPDFAPVKTDFSPEELNELSELDGIKIDGDGPIIFNANGLERVVVPKSARMHVFLSLHVVAPGLHNGTAKTGSFIMAQFWWPGVTTDVRLGCRRCWRCRWAKAGPPEKIETGGGSQIATAPYMVP
jgi:hypothetical protein